MPGQSGDDLRFRDDRPAALLDWWRKRRAALGHLPGRQHFNPVSVKPLLPWIFMADVEGAGDPAGRLRFRWRLLGSELTMMADRNATGRWFDELYPEPVYGEFVRSYVEVVRQHRAVQTGGTMAFASAARNFFPYEAVKVPLAADGRTVDLILGLVAPVAGGTTAG